MIPAPTNNQPNRMARPSKEQKEERYRTRKAIRAHNDKISLQRASLSKILTTRVSEELRQEFLTECKQNPVAFWAKLRSSYGYEQLSDQQRGAELLRMVGMEMKNNEKFKPFKAKLAKIS